MEAVPFRVIHGGIDAFYFSFGSIAYAPDVSHIPEESLPSLKDPDILILSILVKRQGGRLSATISSGESLRFVIAPDVEGALISTSHLYPAASCRKLFLETTLKAAD